MTRTHTKKPVWTWRCDSCFREFDIGRTQHDLPTLDEMRERGWEIPDNYGDKCPACVLAGKEANDE